MFGVLRQGQLHGYWIQKQAPLRCASALLGSYYWGKLQIQFTDRKFTAHSGYCDAALLRTDFAGVRPGDSLPALTTGLVDGAFVRIKPQPGNAGQDKLRMKTGKKPPLFKFVLPSGHIEKLPAQQILSLHRTDQSINVVTNGSTGTTHFDLWNIKANTGETLTAGIYAFPRFDIQQADGKTLRQSRWKKAFGHIEVAHIGETPVNTAAVTRPTAGASDQAEQGDTGESPAQSRFGPLQIVRQDSLGCHHYQDRNQCRSRCKKTDPCARQAGGCKTLCRILFSPAPPLQSGVLTANRPIPSQDDKNLEHKIQFSVEERSRYE